MIPVSGRCPGEERGYPSSIWGFPGGSEVKNLPEMREIWVLSLDWEASLDEGMATHSSVLAWRIPMDRGTWWAEVHGVPKSLTQLSGRAQLKYQYVLGFYLSPDQD